MHFKHVSYVKPATLKPGAVCALPLQGKLIYGMIGTTEDEIKERTTFFVVLKEDDAAVLGGSSLINLMQLSNNGVLHLPSARFVPEISDASLSEYQNATRFIGIKEAELFFCLMQPPFQFTFSALTGADSNIPIEGMLNLYRWRIEVEGTDGKPVVIFQC